LARNISFFIDVMENTSQRVLGLFAKHPTPGQVKTRLAAQTNPHWAARVAEAFLKDIVARLCNFPAQRVLVFAPQDAESYFSALAQGRFLLVPQTEGDLGLRMEAFLAAQFIHGASSVVLLGTDSPTVPSAFIEQAFEELTRTDLVIGPATDGGYYLVGASRGQGTAGRDLCPFWPLPTAHCPLLCSLRSAHCPLFRGISWGCPTVLRETIAQLEGSLVELKVLSPWYDVDTLDDWQLLQSHLSALDRAGSNADLPNTEALIRRGDFC
jgi:rSAM/selenodomain-associated transferase 1